MNSLLGRKLQAACVNSYGDAGCNDRKDKGRCTDPTHEIWMKFNCMKACDLCTSKSSIIELFDPKLTTASNATTIITL